jgi:alpha-glucosidase
MRAAIDATLAALAPVGATSTRVLENHDVVRLRTRYGSLRRARAPALLLLALPGTVFLHAGQELGLEEVDLPAELRQDPVFLRTGGARRGRDGCRVPLPWSDGAPGFGFTSGTPWLPIPPAWASLAVAEQEADGGSTLALYRRAITLRRELGDGFSWRESRAGTLAFERGDVVCVVNIDRDLLDLPDGDVLLATEDAAWVRV